MQKETFEEWCQRRLVTDLASDASKSVPRISVEEVRRRIERESYRVLKSEDELTEEANERAETMRKKRNLWVKDLIVQAVKLNRGDAKRVAAKLECEDLPTLIAECWDDDASLNTISLVMDRNTTIPDWKVIAVIAAGWLALWGLLHLITRWM